MDVGALGAALVSLRAALVDLSDIPPQEAHRIPIPIRVSEGSVFAEFLDSAQVWLLAAAGLAATAYVTAAATQIAKNDFRDASLRKLVLRAVSRLANVVKIGLHVGGMGVPEFKGTRWRDENREVGIPGIDGEYLYVPAEDLEAYVRFDGKILADLVQPVTQEVTLTIAVIKDGIPDEVTIKASSRHVFTPEVDEEDSAELFPELEHAQAVELTGLVTRGNSGTNSIGLQYKGHILDCHPKRGTVKRFRDCVFEQSTVKGVVNRLAADGTRMKKPKLVLDSVRSIAATDEKLRLL